MAYTAGSAAAFATDYDLASRRVIRPRGRGFDLVVTPRFEHHAVLADPRLGERLGGTALRLVTERLGRERVSRKRHELLAAARRAAAAGSDPVAALAAEASATLHRHLIELRLLAAAATSAREKAESALAAERIAARAAAEREADAWKEQLASISRERETQRAQLAPASERARACEESAAALAADIGWMSHSLTWRARSRILVPRVAAAWRRLRRMSSRRRPGAVGEDLGG